MAALLLMVYVLAAVLMGEYPAMTAQAQIPVKNERIETARLALQELVNDREIMAVVYMCDTYPIRRTASYDSEIVTEVSSGQTVFVRDVYMDDKGDAWECISFFDQNSEYEGYIPRNYLVTADERFLQWEAQYGMNPDAYATDTVSENGAGKSSYADIERFPKSYREALTALKKKHPTWTFVPMNTGLDWDTVIANEIIGGKSLVYKTFPEYTKEGAFDDGYWYYASKEILEYYMDPRNSLTEDRIFQFEQLTYNESCHTEAALEKFLQNTFMNSSKKAPGTNMTYAHIIWAVGAEEKRKVSPFHLASRIYQEQGDGKSPLISGTYPGYEGLYNHFNVGATGTTTEEVIRRGLEYAKKAKPQWRGAYYSILGGADVISANYIRKGQDTLYLQKYNVNPKAQHALYTHQYMQNISAPASEAKTIRNLYQSANALESPFVFKIPVFKNMPKEASPMPEASHNVVLQIPAGYDSTVYVDGVEQKAEARNGRQIVSVNPKKEAETAVVYKYNESGVPVGMYVWTLQYKDGAYIETARPKLADLLSYHGFSIRITGKSGIRFKTGISAELRKQLLADGVNGYRLKEYGTLVMNNANRKKYPMIKDGEKVLVGMSYGKTENALTDKIYETVGGRHRYTSVLVGLPAEQYKTEYAFRGYIVLEKNGEETTLYGPVMARSIYSLAKQVLQAGTYPPGSDAEVFLQQMITDADDLGKEKE